MVNSKVLARLPGCRDRIAALGTVWLLLGPLEAASGRVAIHAQGASGAGALIEMPHPPVDSTKNSLPGRRFEHGRFLIRQTATRAEEAWSGTWRYIDQLLPRKAQVLAGSLPGASNLRHSQLHLHTEQDHLAPHSAPAAELHKAADGSDGGRPAGGDTERPDTTPGSSPAETAPGPAGLVHPSTPHISHTHEARPPWQQGKSVTAKPNEVVEIKTTGVALTYDITEIRAQAGDTLTIRYDNTESEMAHNIVVVKTEKDIMPVGVAALGAHRHEYIPKDKMDRIIAFSKLAYPGDTVEFSFVVPPPGIYPYICTYSAHFTMMQGRLVSLPPEPDKEERTRTSEETDHSNRNH